MDLKEIANNAIMDAPIEDIELPPIIPNSELQLDGDISCYMNSWPDQAMATDIRNLKKHIEIRRLLAGCETVVVYTTNGKKAGREDIAQVQEYQATRAVSDPEKKHRVEQLREFLRTYESSTVRAAPQWEIEADDAISIRQRELIAQGRISKIMTVDKDLDMVPGIHIDYNTFEETIHPDGYGKLRIDVTGAPKKEGGTGVKKKVRGIGTSFFWAQLLMGDKADHIPGLPTLPGWWLNKNKPTRAILKAQATLDNPRATRLAKQKAQAVLDARKPMNVGQITAYDILDGCTSDKEAFHRVRECYLAWYGNRVFDYKTWRGETIKVTAGDMMIEQAKLLWMLRTPDDDALTFFQSIFS